MKHRALGPAIVLVAVLSGCGLKGALYLPEKSGDVTIRPAPAPASPAPEAPAEPPATSEPTAKPESPPEDPPRGPDRG